jgi:ABC-type phosphate/phosphonate transport system substrate-binding protein
MAVQLRIHPELGERLRVVETLGPAPSQPVVVRSELAPGVKEKLRSRLLGLRGSTLRDHFVDAFAPAPDYSTIAAVVGTAPY